MTAPPALTAPPSVPMQIRATSPLRLRLADLHAHPVLGPLDGDRGIDAVGGHEERHAAQVHEIADALLASGASHPA